MYADPNIVPKTRSKLPLGKFVLLKLKKSVQFANYPQIGPICTQSIHERLNISSVGQCFISGWGSYKRSAVSYCIRVIYFNLILYANRHVLGFTYSQPVQQTT